MTLKGKIAIITGSTSGIGLGGRRGGSIFIINFISRHGSLLLGGLCSAIRCLCLNSYILEAGFNPKV